MSNRQVVLFSLSEIARRYEWSHTYTHRLVQTGKLKAELVGKTFYVLREDLVEFERAYLEELEADRRRIDEKLERIRAEPIPTKTRAEAKARREERLGKRGREKR